TFLGNRELFKGLYLENNWDWGQTYPVIHFSFGGSSAYQSQETLVAIINNTLSQHAKHYDVNIDLNNYGIAFDQLIKALWDKHQTKVVILIDEYDKPILDVITDNVQARLNREILKGLYSWIKDNDAYIKFVLLTGVSKFSKVSLFSGLNNLNDISLNASYSDICGYTQAELEDAFKDFLVDVDKEQLKLWYNGYNFAGGEKQKVYNPFDILLFFYNNKQYRNYWFETATPTFLVKLLQHKNYYFPNLEKLVVGENSLSSFDVDNISLTTLLFQTGYLTIKEEAMLGMTRAYVLSYPNLEVKASLNSKLAEIGSSLEDKNLNLSKLAACLATKNIDDLANVFRSYFASIPNDWYRNNDIQNYEGFCASIVYSYFCALGYTTIAEDVTNVGKIDLTVKLEDRILILEFKLSQYGDAKSAITQIKNNKYAQKYAAENKTIYLIGVSFDKQTRNVADFIWEKYC
ncbi:MAG TPA: AAA family ATPase, partial [Aquella sp.]|nr:AAA family ATPase [Aquella sp.]